MRRVTTMLLAAVCLLAGGVSLAPAEETGEEREVVVEAQPMTREQIEMLRTATGAELYGELCSACHGGDGRSVAAVEKAMGRKIPDLRELSDRSDTGTFPREHVATMLRCPIENGGPGTEVETMPCWARVFGQSGCGAAVEGLAIEKIVDHVATLQR